MNVQTNDAENYQGGEAPKATGSPTKAFFDKSSTLTLTAGSFTGCEPGPYVLGETAAETPRRSNSIQSARQLHLLGLHDSAANGGKGESILLADMKGYGQKSSVQEV